jgi:segregation and condensation protein B
MGNVAEMRVIVGDKDRETERAEELRILEALLFAAEGPLDEKVLGKRLPADVDVRALLTQLQKEYEPRGVNLVRVAGKWTLRTASDLAWLLTHEATVTRKLSRAAIETLAIVAYHQPVTRAEIEDIRGVTTSKGTLDVLLETGWIRLRGRRKAPGRPVTFWPGGAQRFARPRRAQGRRPDRAVAARGLQCSGAVGRSGPARRRRSARTGRSRPRSGAARRPQRGIEPPAADLVIGKRPSQG